MDDREVVAAIAAGDPRGIAVAYDRYAAALYGYCSWMVRHPASAAEAVRDTFVVAGATLGDLSDPVELRPWLYAVSRQECRRLIRTGPSSRDELADAADPPAYADGDGSGQTEWQPLIRGILDELAPREREVVELNLRHDVHGADLAVALGLSRRRAHALESRARARLEKPLQPLLITRPGRQACPELDALLADGDGQPNEQTRNLVSGHIGRCKACTDRGRDALRPAALSCLPPPIELPAGLRDQVLRLSSSAAPDAADYRRRVTRRAEHTWLASLSQATRLMRADGIRGNPGAAVATVAMVAWVVAAVIVTLLVFAGSR